MDQQQDTKLDVKEAAAVPQEHPQWDLSDSDSDHNDQVRLSMPTAQLHVCMPSAMQLRLF